MYIFSPRDIKHRKLKYRWPELVPLMERSAVNNPGLFPESSKLNTKINWGRPLRF